VREENSSVLFCFRSGRDGGTLARGFVRVTDPLSPLTLSLVSSSSVFCFFCEKLFASTGKAAWIMSTTFLVLVVPLIIETDREQQLVELEQQQMGVLTATKPSS